MNQTRLTNAERSLQLKVTKKAHEEVRIPKDKIATYTERFSDLRRHESRSNDSRIFPMYFARWSSSRQSGELFVL